MRRFITFMTVAAAVGTIATTVASAHAIYFAQRGGQLALIYGVGGDDLDMVRRLPLVNAVHAYDVTGKEVPTKLTSSVPVVVADVSSKPAIVTALMDYGFWTWDKTGKDFNKPKGEVPNEMITSHNFKYTVHLLQNAKLSVPFPVLPDQTLQIVPVDRTLPALLGESLKLRVLFKGKPVAGAEVLADFVNDSDGKPVMTDKDGAVTIKVRNQGLNVVSAVLVTPPDDPKKTDRVEHEATLSFVLPHKPEPVPTRH